MGMCVYVCVHVCGVKGGVYGAERGGREKSEKWHGCQYIIISMPHHCIITQGSQYISLL